MTTDEPHRQQRRKNWVLLAVLVTMVSVLYAISLLKYAS
jgi:hypothetical protein